MSRSASQIVRDSVSDAVGSHRFSPHQIETFQTLQHTIACCGYLFGILATIDGLQSAFVAFYDTDRITRVGVPYGQLASVLHDGSSAFFLLQVAGCLHTLVQETGNHMPHLMKVRYAVHLCIHTSQEYTQAIVQLTNLFLQLAVFCASISIIQFIEAALLFPNIKYVIYTILGAAALLRSICLGYVYSKYHADVLLGAADVWDRRQQQQRDSSAPTEHSEAPQSTRQAARSWWDRVALRVNGSFLVPAALPSEFKVGRVVCWEPTWLGPHVESAASTVHPTQAAAPPQNEFEFTAFDEQLCLALVGAMRMAGVFYFLEGCATFLFGMPAGTAAPPSPSQPPPQPSPMHTVIAAVLSRQLSRGLPLGMEVVSCMAYASMIFGAADAFQRIVTTQGGYWPLVCLDGCD